MTSAVWRTVGPDLLDLAASEQQRLAQGFGSWLHLLDDRCTFVICKQLWPEPAAGPGGPPVRPTPRGGATAADSAARRITTYLVQERHGQGRDQELLDALRNRCEVRSEAADAAPALARGPLLECARELRIGGRHLHSLRLHRLPGVGVNPGWLWQLLGGAGDCKLALTISPRDPELADRDLRLRLRGLRARELAAVEQPPDPRLRLLSRAARDLREVLARGEERVFELALTVTLAADSPAELRTLTRELETAAASLRATFVPAYFDELPAHLESLGQPPSGTRPTMLAATGEVSTLWPWFEGPEANRLEQSLIGIHRRTGRWVGLDLHHDPRLNNANLAVVAASGAGKSYLAGLLAMEAARRGQSVVVVDPENEHQRWCELAGGTFLDLVDPRAARFNMLEMGPAVETVPATVELVSILCGPLSNSERAALLETVGELIAQPPVGRAPVLGDCLPRLQARLDGEALAARLQPWVSGEPQQLFSTPGRGPAVSSVLVLGTRNVPESWTPAVTLLISSWLWHWVREHPGEKQLIVDEAGMLADSPALHQLMERLARRVRKYQGSLILLTQTGADLTATHFGEVVAVNSATQLLGSQAEIGARRLQGSLGLEEADRRFLQQAGRGDFLLVCGWQRIPLRVTAPAPYHRWLTHPGPPPAAASAGQLAPVAADRPA